MAEWIYGRRTVAEHLAAAPGTCLKLVVAQGRRLPPDLEDAARAAGVCAEELAPAALDRLAEGGNHQGVCLRVGGWGYVSLEDLLARLVGHPFPLLLALDQVQDPHNLGAVLRVADGVGAVGVILPKDRAAGLGAAAARTAAGAAATVPVAQVVNLARSLDACAAAGCAVVGAAGEGSVSLYDCPVHLPAVLVLGSEHRGIRPNVAKRCRTLVSLPMAGQVGSLNVAVACGVIAYELRRRQPAPGAG
ncbi:MAG: 23S rRNA (guanosine(2251)-2'-O)-methyltransferase RlmB [Deferrisomatales bacterium]|nr:23S rRNA (guanosine(2251)-2'-O)-methyltransferase RlmB [Deferrisomatales bacterium]